MLPAVGAVTVGVGVGLGATVGVGVGVGVGVTVGVGVGVGVGLGVTVGVGVGVTVGVGVGLGATVGVGLGVGLGDWVCHHLVDRQDVCQDGSSPRRAAFDVEDRERLAAVTAVMSSSAAMMLFLITVAPLGFEDVVLAPYVRRKRGRPRQSWSKAM